MGCDRDDGDHWNSFLASHLIRTIVPEDAICARGSVLGIGLKDLFPMDARQRDELVCVKARMMGIDFEVSESLPNLGEERRAWAAFSSAVNCASAVGVNFNFRRIAYFRAWRANEPRLIVFPSADSLSPCLTLARACAFS